MLGWRSVLPFAAMVVYGTVGKWDQDSLGLRLRPLQGAGYWVKLTLIIGGVLLAWVTVWFLTAPLIWPLVEPLIHIRIRALTPSEFLHEFPHSCILAPVFEEATYRFALCTPAARIVRPWGTVLLSGCAFAALHLAYGNPSPDNMIAGFFFAWAYLKSGSMVVPISLHALGNLFVMSVQLGNSFFGIAGTA